MLANLSRASHVPTAGECLTDRLVLFVQLDNHYIFTSEQMENIKTNLNMHRLDSNIWRKKKHNAGVC
jgi:hypothetical protein